MRLILIILFLLIFFIISIPLFAIEFIMGKFNYRAKVASSQKIVCGAFHVVLFIAGVKRTVVGVENVPKDEPVLYVSNHRSYFDIPISYVSLPTLTGFIAKKEIGKVPILRTWMKNLQCLFLDRQDIRQGMKTILKAIEQVKEGYSIFISPEGTRNQEKEMLPFKEGSFKVAEKTGCAIVPVALTNTDEVFEKHLPWIKPAKVVIEFGKPIYPKELDADTKKHLGAHVQGIIKEMLDKNQSLV
ncbi:MAG: 1-acyl-sn-glycerol-3-phosphate acyltransferase [Clostridiales bacterium]|nr:1-acyl-sn-glycerol-3-phosphate acyltransferase [Clostridiales bacterium]